MRALRAGRACGALASRRGFAGAYTPKPPTPEKQLAVSLGAAQTPAEILAVISTPDAPALNQVHVSIALKRLFGHKNSGVTPGGIGAEEGFAELVGSLEARVLELAERGELQPQGIANVARGFTALLEPTTARTPLIGALSAALVEQLGHEKMLAKSIADFAVAAEHFGGCDPSALAPIAAKVQADISRGSGTLQGPAQYRLLNMEPGDLLGDYVSKQGWGSWAKSFAHKHDDGYELGMADFEANELPKLETARLAQMEWNVANIVPLLRVYAATGAEEGAEEEEEQAAVAMLLRRATELVMAEVRNEEGELSAAATGHGAEVSLPLALERVAARYGRGGGKGGGSVTTVLGVELAPTLEVCAERTALRAASLPERDLCEVGAAFASFRMCNPRLFGDGDGESEGDGDGLVGSAAEFLEKGSQREPADSVAFLCTVSALGINASSSAFLRGATRGAVCRAMELSDSLGAMDALRVGWALAAIDGVADDDELVERGGRVLSVLEEHGAWELPEPAAPWLLRQLVLHQDELLSQPGGEALELVADVLRTLTFELKLPVPAELAPLAAAAAVGAPRAREGAEAVAGLQAELAARMGTVHADKVETGVAVGDSNGLTVGCVVRQVGSRGQDIALEVIPPAAQSFGAELGHSMLRERQLAAMGTRLVQVGLSTMSQLEKLDEPALRRYTAVLLESAAERAAREGAECDERAERVAKLVVRLLSLRRRTVGLSDTQEQTLQRLEAGGAFSAGEASAWLHTLQQI